MFKALPVSIGILLFLSENLEKLNFLYDLLYIVT